MLTLWSSTTFYVLILFSYVYSADAIDYAVLREKLKKFELDGFIVTPHDEHQNIFVAPKDGRLQYLTGFSGYFGDALVTANKMVFWTDEKYIEQAQSQLDSNWTIVEASPSSTSVTLAQWLIEEFKGQDSINIGADPKLVPAFIWLQWEKELTGSNIKLVKVGTGFGLNGHHNLVDSVWTTDRPKEDSWKIKYDPMNATNWIEKIADVRNLMQTANADALVLTDMTEIAWLLNIRGYGLPMIYTHKAYLIIQQRYIKLFIDENEIPNDLKEEWKVENCNNPNCIKLLEYNKIFTTLRERSEAWNSVWVPSRCGFTPGISMMIYDSIPDEKRLLTPSPIITLRATKTKAEVEGTRRAHIQDGSSTTQFMAYMQTYFSDNNKYWYVYNSVQAFREFFFENLDATGIPLPVYLGFGENIKVPCYNKTCVETYINKDFPIVNLHYSKNYKGGTVTLARTIHFGDDPGARFKKAYTKTLINLIKVARTTFPANITIDELRKISNSSLVNVEYDDLRNSAHGVNHLISFNSSSIPSPSIQYSTETCSRCNIRRLQPGQFLLNGFSKFVDDENNRYWIILESTMAVVKLRKKDSEGRRLLGLEDISHVPYDLNLLDMDMLNHAHRSWLIEHNEKIRKNVLKEMDIRRWVFRTFYEPEKYLLERTRWIKE